MSKGKKARRKEEAKLDRAKIREIVDGHPSKTTSL